MPHRVRYADHAGVWPAVLASMPRVAWTELDHREGVSTRRSCATLPGRRACRGEAEPATMKPASCLPAAVSRKACRRKRRRAAEKSWWVGAACRLSTSTQAKAAAELTQAREEARQAIERQAADVRLAELALHTAQDEEAQTRQLVARQLVARDELRKATARLREAHERLDKARLPVEWGKVEVVRRALTLVEKDYAVRRQELETKRGIKHGEVAALRIELANLDLERRQAVIRAPLDGMITVGDIKVGDLLERGKPVVEIAAQHGFRFEASVPSEDVGHLRVEMPARIKLDAYDYQRYGSVAGTVVFLSPDSGVGEGQRTATYLVKIELAGNELGRGELHGQVKLGMTGQADIVTGQERLLALLVKKLRQTISLG